MVKIRIACEDENRRYFCSFVCTFIPTYSPEKASSNEQRLERENQVKLHTRELKKTEVAESKVQTEEYRLRLAERKKEYDQSRKKLNQG